MIIGTSERIVTSIDIGTTKISVLIAKIRHGQIDILGIGKYPSKGLAKGIVVDIGLTIESIKNALSQAEKMADRIVEQACIGIAGGHIQSFNSHGVVAIKNGLVKSGDIAQAVTAAQAIPIAPGQHILHVIPQYFIIDGHRIQNPLGMHGVRLEVFAHIITGSVSAIQNLITCCQAADIYITDIILEPLASAAAVLSPDEKTLGAAIIDIGGGTTDLAVYQHNGICHTKVIPIAGNHFTNDLAIGLRITLGDAEQIKKEYGTSDNTGNAQAENFQASFAHQESARTVSAEQIAAIIQPRAYELLSLIKQEIDTQQLHATITTGAVLTGGGSLLHGIRQLAHDMLHVPIRIGYPHTNLHVPDSLRHPLFATGYGMLVYTAHKDQERSIAISKFSLFERMRSWVVNYF
jgi:cell division protein FtsA